MTHRRVLLTAGLSLALVAGCTQDELFSPLVPAYQGGAMFVRYVALGNSITAGFQSGGINDSTQKASYVRMVANAMGSAYYYPSFTIPGCPPPIDTLFTASGIPHTLGAPLAPPCALRSPAIPPYLSNVAVPGATTFDPWASGPTVSSNALTQLILGGRSQVEAAAAARPTFVSVWIGNNDVLGAATDTANAGTVLKITPPALFQANYDAMLAQLDSIPTIQGGILIGVADVAAIPYFSYGFYYFGAYAAGKLPPTMTVDPNCAPSSLGGIGDTVLVPFRYGFGLIGAAQAGASVTLDCSDDHNIEPAELANLHATVAAYNAFISGRATARSWAYLDPNVAFAALRADTNQVKPFPNTAATNCWGANAAGKPFGLAFSCDGIHPSSATHRLIAQTLVQVINATYSSAIPAVP
jgi:hypothetical protein